MKILSWNVNGIRACAQKGFLRWLEKESPDLLCLQETKASAEQLPDELREPKGYHAYWHLGEKKGYSGVALLSKEKPLSVTYGFGEKRFDCEGRIIIAEYPQFVLYGIYFPNGQKDDGRLKYKLDFYDCFLKHVSAAVKRGKAVLVAGDVNTAHHEIDLAHPKANSGISGFLPIERAWMDRFVATGFVDTFRVFHSEPDVYSWWSVRTAARERNIGWRIDYVYVDGAHCGMIRDAFIMADVMGSDHCPVGIVLQTTG